MAEEKIVQDVLNEIKTLGDNTKENYDTLRKNYEDLKAEIDKNSDDIVTKEKIEKLAEDISLRQDELDKKAVKDQAEYHERMDKLEVMAKKSPRSGLSENEDKYDEAKSFYIANAASRGQVSWQQADNMEVNTGDYKEYQKNFNMYLRAKDIKAMSPEQYKALMVGSDPDGGYTVSPEMSTRMYTQLYETDPIRQLATVESITTDSIMFPVDPDQAGAAWEVETVSTSNITTPQLAQLSIPVHALATRPKITQQLIEDSGINIESWLAGKAADKFGRTEAASFIDGDGLGKPKGLLTYTSGTAWNNVEQITMGAAATLTADGFVKVKYGLIEQYMNRGTWLMSRSSVLAAMLLKDGDGNYLWKPSMIASDTSSSILGSPVRMSTTMPTITNNALSVLYGDFREAYVIVDRIGITVQRDPYTAKPFVEFYFRKRVGGGLSNGQAIKIGKIAV